MYVYDPLLQLKFDHKIGGLHKVSLYKTISYSKLTHLKLDLDNFGLCQDMDPKVIGLLLQLLILYPFQ